MQSNLLAQLEKDRKRREELLKLRKSTHNLGQEDPSQSTAGLESRLRKADIDLSQSYPQPATVQHDAPAATQKPCHELGLKQPSKLPHTPNFQNPMIQQQELQQRLAR